MGRSAKIRVTAPAGMDALDIAQAVVGDDMLLKAEHVRDKTQSPYAPMRALNEQVSTAYQFMLRRMIADLEAYATGGVAKAALYRRLVTAADLEAFKRIVRDHHAAFAVGVVHPEAVTVEELQRLMDAGLVPQDLLHAFPAAPGQAAPKRVEFADAAYHYGRSLAPMKSVLSPGPSGPSLFEVLATARAQEPLTTRERDSVQWARQNAAVHIQNLGSRVAGDVAAAVMRVEQQRATIRDTVAEGMERRDTWRQVAQDIGHATGDWSLDLRRIAATETTQAVHEGIVAGLEKHTKEDPKNIMVAKIPSSDACDFCKRLHLEGGKPRVFALAELKENGTNVGRKRRDWQAVVGPTHPWCFPAGVPVCTAEGHRPIESLNVGGLVLTHLGRLRSVTALSSRQFDGDLVVITCGNQVLEVTPEHPLLTERGWVAAKEIQPGDCLLQTPELSENARDPEGPPAQDGEKILFAGVLPLFARRAMPVAGIGFHDGPQGGKADIGIENPDRQLWNSCVSAALEQAEDFCLQFGRNRALLAGLRRLHLLHDGPGLTSAGVMRKLSEAHSLFRAAFGGENELLLASVAEQDAGFSESPYDTSAVYSVNLRKLLDAVAIAVTTDNFFDRNDFAVSHEVSYRTAYVSAVNLRPFTGLVYNFAVDQDESYVANGFVSHNCGCAIVYVPSGWNFNKEHLLMPDKLERSYMLDHDLRKAQDMTYTASVPDKGVVVRVADPRLREAVEAVVARTPSEVFDKTVGVTLITTDMPRIQNPLEEHDLAYWTANEIRLMHDLAPEKVGRVLPHEIGHSLNVYLIAQLGSVAAVRKWHDELWEVSKEEGLVSKYAAREPIENAAEVTMLYLYDRPRLMLEYPRQFSFCHRAYSGIFRRAHAQVSGENRTAV